MPAFSDFGSQSTLPSPAARMMAHFASSFRPGIDVNLGVGYVSEQTIPRDRIAQAIAQVLTDTRQYSGALNYGGPAGSPRLVNAVRRMCLRRRFGSLDAATLDRKRIVIGCSAATSILDALADVLEPGIVITTDPVYYIYTHLLRRRGHRILAVPQDDQGLDIAQLRDQLARLGPDRRNVRMIYLPTISNPTSTVLSNDRRREAARIAAELSRESGRLVPLVLDLAYEWLMHDPAVEPPRSPMLEDEAGVVYEINTVSKIFSPALRIGWIVGEDSPLLHAVVQRTSDVGFNAPLLLQEAVALLLDDFIDAHIENVHQIYRDKARRAAHAIDQHLGEFIAHRTGGQAGFYYYLTFKSLETTEDSPLFAYLSRTTADTNIDGPADNPHPRVVYLPGQWCVEPDGRMRDLGRRQLRISYGYEPAEAVQRAVAWMGEAARWAQTASARA